MKVGWQTLPSVSIRAGDVDGRGVIYDGYGGLIPLPNESIFRIAAGWDMHAWSPWRRIAPRMIFLGFNSKASSRLYITSRRIVLIREIDPWREVAGDMTPLGMPTAVADQARLKKLKSLGIREYCEIWPETMKVANSSRSANRGSWLRLRLEDLRGRRYTLHFWKTDGRDEDTLSVLRACFQRRSRVLQQ